MQFEMMHVKSDDPSKCVNPNCNYKAIEGCQHCAACGGNAELAAKQKRELKNYRLGKMRARLEHFTYSDGLKSLREEIGILRVLMEEKLNSLNSPIELIAHTHTISDLALKIEKLVSSCDKLDKSMANYLDKGQLVQLGMEIVSIINKHIEDVDVIDKISEEFATLIERTLNEGPPTQSD